MRHAGRIRRRAPRYIATRLRRKLASTRAVNSNMPNQVLFAEALDNQPELAYQFYLQNVQSIPEHLVDPRELRKPRPEIFRHPVAQALDVVEAALERQLKGAIFEPDLLKHAPDLANVLAVNAANAEDGGGIGRFDKLPENQAHV